MEQEDLISRNAVIDLIQSKFIDGALEVGDETMVGGYGLLDEISDLPRAYDVQAVTETMDAINSLAKKHARRMLMEVKESEECPWNKKKVYLKAIGTHELDRVVLGLKEKAELIAKIPLFSKDIYDSLLVLGKEEISFQLDSKKELVAEVVAESYGELYICFTVRDAVLKNEYKNFKIDYASSEDSIRKALMDFFLLGEDISNIKSMQEEISPVIEEEEK